MKDPEKTIKSEEMIEAAVIKFEAKNQESYEDCYSYTELFINLITNWDLVTPLQYNTLTQYCNRSNHLMVIRRVDIDKTLKEILAKAEKDNKKREEKAKIDSKLKAEKEAKKAAALVKRKKEQLEKLKAELGYD